MTPTQGDRRGVPVVVALRLTKWARAHDNADSRTYALLSAQLPRAPLRSSGAWGPIRHHTVNGSAATIALPGLQLNACPK